MTHIVFCDTETTGLALDADIWEIALIVRIPGMPDVEYHSFVEHNTAKALRLPESFRADHDARYDEAQALSRHDAARLIADLTTDAHIVGAVPNFDTERIALLLRAHGIEPAWHYHLIDVENLAVGWILGRFATQPTRAERQAVSLPWRSDDLAVACGIPPVAEADRHTAMGDARWVRAWYDAIMGAPA